MHLYHLLIVDDQPDLVEDLATNLPWDNLNISSVYRAYSAMEALDIMKVNPIDIVITDIRMPGTSGLDLIEIIRTTWTHIKCILLSGYNDFDYAKRAIQSHVSDYLLKPVDDDELIETVRRSIQQLEDRWLEVISLQKAVDSIRSNLPIIKTHLLESMLQQDAPYAEHITEQLQMIDIPIDENTTYFMMLIRLEDYFYEQNEQDHSLMQYAISNIAEHLFQDEYNLWYLKDRYQYLTYLIFPNNEQLSPLKHTETIEYKAVQLQHYVKLYLKGTVSLVVSKQNKFPQSIHSIYEQLLLHMRQNIGEERDFMLKVNDTDTIKSDKAYALQHLYAPPQLNHLLETGQWEHVEKKLDAIFTELDLLRNDTYEYISEAYYAILSSLCYAIHKNRLKFADLQLNNMMSKEMNFHTISQLKSWTNEHVEQLKAKLSSRNQDSKSSIIQRVQGYAASHLADVSLQSIAEHVYLNPSYLSKLYKLETGEGISEYISRLKLETAAHLLRTSNDKIYEIASKIGYSKTSYFIKLFKDNYNLTPQEFRDHNQ